LFSGGQFLTASLPVDFFLIRTRSIGGSKVHKEFLMKKLRIANRKKIKRIRGAILTYLDKNNWPWSWSFSLLLDQIDSKLFGMRSDLD
jgi:hypothetical protein